MPDMAKMMKIMIYVSPLMMLFFFNSYASGLSLYYFVSNTITIGIMLVIKTISLMTKRFTLKFRRTRKRARNKANSTKTSRGNGAKGSKAKDKENKKASAMEGFVQILFKKHYLILSYELHLYTSF
jgi:YidC/Oxa1 family membrane protein insertase